jgi:hypothetical protein
VTQNPHTKNKIKCKTHNFAKPQNEKSGKRWCVEGPIPLITPPMLTLYFEKMEIWIKGRRGGDSI